MISMTGAGAVGHDRRRYTMVISKIAIDAAEKIYAISMSTGDIAAYVQAAIDEATASFTAHYYIRCECGRDVKVTVTTEGGCIWVDGKEVSDGDK